MSRLEAPTIAVDLVIFGLQNDRLMVLLHRRDEAPYAGELALPGTAVRVNELLIESARRALKTRIKPSQEWLDQIHLEQLATFDSLFRDPRGRTVSVAYIGLTQGISSAPEAVWVEALSLSPGRLPFDHAHILSEAVIRLRGKLKYTTIASKFLPELFRIDALLKIYEAIFGGSLNRANFRNKLLKIGLIEKVAVQREGITRQGGRPAHLYRFTKERIEITERDFI